VACPNVAVAPATRLIASALIRHLAVFGDAYGDQGKAESNMGAVDKSGDYSTTGRVE